MNKNTKNYDILILDNQNNFTVDKKKKFNINLNRIAFIFIIISLFFILYSTRLIFLASKTFNNNNIINDELYRADIVDRNGDYVSKSVLINNVGINPNLVKDKKKLLIKLKYTFPEKDFSALINNLNKKKFFYVEKKLSPERYEKFRLLGEKSIRLEPKIARVYPDKSLFSHVAGQIDDDNNGISGLEKSYDSRLKNTKKNLKLTLDRQVQSIIRDELKKSKIIFKNRGSSGILMNINNGEILSLVSLPDYNLNKRQKISDEIFINRATKAVYELGSVFKSFTLAAALNYDLIKPGKIFLNLEKKMRCGNRVITEYDKELSNNLSVEEILIK